MHIARQQSSLEALMLFVRCWIISQRKYWLDTQKRKRLYKIRDYSYNFFTFLGINTIFSIDRVLEIHLLKLVTRKIIKVHMKIKKFQVDKSFLRKKNKAVGITHFNFKEYYKAIVIKTIHRFKNSHQVCWNRSKSPKINSCIFSQLVFHKGAKNIQWTYSTTKLY